MRKYEIALIGFGLLLVLGLTQLPTVVVENDTDQNLDPHDFSVTATDAEAISSLKQILSTEDFEKNANFADSLANYYLKYGFLDSAIVLGEKLLAIESSLTAEVSASNILYSCFERSITPERAAEIGIKLQPLLEKLSAEFPSELSFKNRLAMVLVTTSNPMSGIQVLREVLEEDPDNRTAIINLGLLSIQSGQYDKAVGRFERLIELDSTDYESMVYLGVSFQELGRPEESKKLFEKVAKAEGADPALKAAAVEYLKN